MSTTIYALLVGINTYPSPVRSLGGCVNDVTHMHELLATRLQGTDDHFIPRLLINEQATRQGFIDAWRSHLGRAGPGDVALFYYSGHGSQETAPPEFWQFEPDHRNETLVCYDSRLPGGWDLADKELAQLISEVTANGPHFAVILDCCHAGSGTRDASDITTRQEPADERGRPITSYIVTPSQLAWLAPGQPETSGQPSPWPTVAGGRHILLAACRPEQKAKETSLPGPAGLERRGVFSYYLQDSLQQSGRVPSYRDLLKRVNALVQQQVNDQHPQATAIEPPDLDRPFLGRAIPPAPATFTLRKDKSEGWMVDAGAVHGIPQPADGCETPQLAIFPFAADTASLRSMEHAVGQASVTRVRAGDSLVVPVRFDGGELDDKTTYKAVVISTPLPPLTVAFEGDEAGLHRVRQALAHLNGPDSPSLLVREGELAGAEYRLLADAISARYLIRRRSDARWLAVETSGLDDNSAALVALRLEHVARWVSTARLSNPTSTLPRDAVRLEIYRVDLAGQREAEPVDSSSGVRFEYTQVNGQWRWPRIQVRLQNTSDRRLYCMLLDLADDYSIFTGLLPEGGVWLDAGQEAWATARVSGQLSTIIPAYIPDGLFSKYRALIGQHGLAPEPMQVHDTLKLIVSTSEVDATLLEQAALPIDIQARSVRSLPATLNNLSRLMARVHTRHFGDAPGSSEALPDWMTMELATTVVRPVEAGAAY